MPYPQLIVLDFDGTFTRVDDEAMPFLEAYLRGLAKLAGAPIDADWAAARAAIEADPDRYGWEYGGRIVAPSHADPYILATTIAQIVLRQRGLLDHGAARPPELEALFRDAYAHAAIAFRDDAREVIDALLAGSAPVVVVTNSRTSDVERKLRALGVTLPVHGDAQKFVLAESDDPRFAAVPSELSIEGLGRPLALRRGKYFEVLARLWRETGAGPRETLVCGDIFELDLAMPAQLGARVHMVGRPTTPAYERAAVEAAGGTFSTALRGLLDVLDR